MKASKRIKYQERLTFWQGTLKRLIEAHTALVEGGVRSFKIENRELTHFDISSLLKEIKEAEQMVDEYEALLAGYGSRKIVGVVPRDW